MDMSGSEHSQGRPGISLWAKVETWDKAAQKRNKTDLEIKRIMLVVLREVKFNENLLFSEGVTQPVSQPVVTPSLN
jgi:hypothetical protein